MTHPCKPTFDQHHDGFGVQNVKPRISWQFSTDEASPLGWTQAAYDVQVDEEVFHRESTESVLVPWPTEALSARQIRRVRVRCYGRPTGTDQLLPTDWSRWSTVEAGLLARSDWFASLVTTDGTLYASDGSLCPVQFSKTFHLPDISIKHARLYITSHGVFEARLNGVRVGDHIMSPGWSSYRHRLNYEVFDISEYLCSGSDNLITVEVGAGWFASALGWQGGRRCRYGKRLAVLAQLEIHLGDTVHRVCTDDSWTYSRTVITSSEIYNGEVWDLRSPSPSAVSGVDPRVEGSSIDASQSVVLGDFPNAIMSTSESPPVRVTQVKAATRLFKSRSGKTIFDFGQNLVGRVRIKNLQKSSGKVVTLRHAEVMENGELGTRPLRTARSTDTIVFGDAGLFEWTPKFTFHGFRFVEVDGWEQDDKFPLTLDSLVAEVMHTNFKRTGFFECSHPMLNQLHENTVWSMRGNFLSLPTDCPQRDERLGWTGDIAVFAPSAAFLFNVTGMLSEWVKDLTVEQAEPHRGGVPPLVVPGAIEKEHPEDDIWWPIIPQAIWGDAAILVPWSLYEASGDADLLKQQLQSMKMWLNRGIQRGPDGLWDEDVWQLGDWLDPTAPPEDPGNARTDGTLVADAYLIHVTGIFEKMLDALSLSHDLHLAENYKHNVLRTAFQDKYVTEKGLIVGDSQTILTLAIHFDLLDKRHHTSAANRLARQVQKSQFKIATGFAGTPFLCHALTQSNQSQFAYRVVQNKSFPSWMYPISQGATTIWERWDSMLPNGDINPGEMTSFNHYALGSVVDWLHRSVGGISPLDPGWKTVLVRPLPGGTVTHANVKFDGPYGMVECRWKLLEETEGQKFEMSLIIPPNSTAYVVLPDQQQHHPNDTGLDMNRDNLGIKGQKVSSGKHVFQCIYKAPKWPPRAIIPPFWDQTQPEYV